MAWYLFRPMLRVKFFFLSKRVEPGIKKKCIVLQMIYYAIAFRYGEPA
jgi:hypothetical protein